jgi:hypothetical protein
VVTLHDEFAQNHDYSPTSSERGPAISLSSIGSFILCTLFNTGHSIYIVPLMGFRYIHKLIVHIREINIYDSSIVARANDTHRIDGNLTILQWLRILGKCAR